MQNMAATRCAGVNDDLDGSEANKAVQFHVTNIARDRGVASVADKEPERCVTGGGYLLMPAKCVKREGCRCQRRVSGNLSGCLLLCVCV